MSHSKIESALPLTAMRIDKWLWVARFFKTRQLAVEAINGGKVQLNGQRTKPGKEVRPGSQLRIHKGTLEWAVEVLSVMNQRRPAKEAQLLYQEHAESIERRAQQTAEQRLLADAGMVIGPRPTKRDRRRIQQFTGA